MNIKAQYTLADFNNYALASDSLGFELISNASFCDFKKKSYVDDRGIHRRRKMVLVGPYFLGDGLKQVWALATGLCIEYYYGYEHAYHLVQVEDRYKQRIYYRGTEFRFITAHEHETREKYCTYGKTLVETVINYLFLLRGELVHVRNKRITDMLSNFTQACLNYPERKRQEEEEVYRKREEIEENDEIQARFRRDNSEGPGKKPIFIIKTEPADDFSQTTDVLRRPLPVLRDRPSYETHIDAEIDREKRAYAKYETMSRERAAKRNAERVWKKKLERSKQRGYQKSAALLKAKHGLQPVIEQEGQDESCGEGTIVEVAEDLDGNEDNCGHKIADADNCQDDSEDEWWKDKDIGLERSREVARDRRRRRT